MSEQRAETHRLVKSVPHIASVKPIRANAPLLIGWQKSIWRAWQLGHIQEQIEGLVAKSVQPIIYFNPAYSRC